MREIKMEVLSCKT